MFRYTLLVALILLMNALGWTNGIALDDPCTDAKNCTKTTLNTDCTGINGSKTCQCATGYTKQGTQCKANLGTTCAATFDCDTVTNPLSICPATGTKICSCNIGYTQQRTKCKANLGTACTATDDCDTTTNPHSGCHETGGYNCSCDIGYTQRGTMCKANLGAACAATDDCDTVTTPDAVCDHNNWPYICAIGANGVCSESESETCVRASLCKGGTCSCSNGFLAHSNLCSKSSAVNAISMLLLLISCFMAKFLKTE